MCMVLASEKGPVFMTTDTMIKDLAKTASLLETIAYTNIASGRIMPNKHGNKCAECGMYWFSGDQENHDEDCRVGKLNTLLAHLRSKYGNLLDLEEE
jgi:hypothetical protein